MSEEQPNLFAALLRRVPTRERSQEENLATEALAYLLRACPAALREILARCGVSRRDAALPATVRTQVSLGDAGVGDVLLRLGRRVTVLIEAKVRSPVDPAQLRRYRRWLDARRGSEARGRLVLLTVARAPREHGVDASLTWTDIAETIGKAPGPAEWVRRDFVGFLKENGMAHAQALRPLDVPRTLRTHAALRDLVGAARGELEHLLARRFVCEERGRSATHGHFGFTVRRRQRGRAHRFCWVGFDDAVGEIGMEVLSEADRSRLETHTDRTTRRYGSRSHWLPLMRADLPRALRGASVEQQAASLARFVRPWVSALGRAH